MPLGNANLMFPAPKREPARKPHLHNSHTSHQPREASQHRGERSRRHSPSNNKEPLRPYTGIPQIDPNSLKMQVVDTIPNRPSLLKHQTSQSTLDEQENGFMKKVVKLEPSHEAQSHHAFQMCGQTNSNSTEITPGEAGWDEDDPGYSGEPTTIHRPAQISTSRQALVQSLDLGPHWSAEADSERARRGEAPVYSNGGHSQRQVIPDHNNDDTFSNLSDDEVDDYNVQTLRNDTTSRATSGPLLITRGLQEIKPQGKTPARNTYASSRTAVPPQGRSSSPLPGQEESALMSMQQQPKLQQSSLARHSVYKQQQPSIPRQLEATKADVNSSLQPSKVSAFHEPSDEERVPESQLQPAQPRTKRAYAEIDYDLEELKSKAYADLDRETFLNDPRAPGLPHAMDLNGTPLSLPQQLSNLKKMKPEDQAALFQSLTDEENEEAGHWFVSKFQDNLKVLMERRLERRKIALKYELEARKREIEVQVKMSDVEEELKHLRQGGGELIKDRSVAGVGGTPRKSEKRCRDA